MRFLSARTLLTVLTLSLAATTAGAAPVFSRLSDSGTKLLASTTAINGSLLRETAGTSLLTIDTQAMAEFRAAGGGTLTVPTAQGGTLELSLEPYDLMAPGASVSYSDATGRHPFTPDVSLFRGHVAGDPDELGGAIDEQHRSARHDRTRRYTPHVVARTEDRCWRRDPGCTRARTRERRGDLAGCRALGVRHQRRERSGLWIAPAR